MEVEARELPQAGDLLFAYGTLKRGGQYHYLLEGDGAEFLSTGRLALPYPLLLAEYPCLLDEPGTGFKVTGELFRILNRETWRRVDRLEDHPREYLRRLETVETGTGPVTAWTYFYRQTECLDPSLQPVEAFPIE